MRLLNACRIRIIPDPLTQARVIFLHWQGALPAATPPEETKILLHKRQPENKHHSDGEEICATEVAPKYASHSTQLPVTGKEQSSLVIAGRI